MNLLNTAFLGFWFYIKQHYAKTFLIYMKMEKFSTFSRFSCTENTLCPENLPYCIDNVNKILICIYVA